MAALAGPAAAPKAMPPARTTVDSADMTVLRKADMEVPLRVERHQETHRLYAPDGSPADVDGPVPSVWERRVP
ncbi:hypothetical protein GCM10009536_33560 [Streptomyces thermocarboxydus]